MNPIVETILSLNCHESSQRFSLHKQLIVVWIVLLDILLQHVECHPQIQYIWMEILYPRSVTTLNQQELRKKIQILISKLTLVCFTLKTQGKEINKRKKVHLCINIWVNCWRSWKSITSMYPKKLANNSTCKLKWNSHMQSCQVSQWNLWYVEYLQLKDHLILNSSAGGIAVQRH